MAVVGGINIDIHMKAGEGLMHPGSSNPSTGWSSAGGVGRNIACTLAGLGLSVRLFGAVGDDLLSAAVVSQTQAAGVDVEGVLQVSGETVGLYTALLHADGELFAGASAMPVMKHVDAAYVAAHSHLLQESRLIVADANIPSDGLQALVDLATEHRIPLVIDPVSAMKAAVLGELTGRVFAATPDQDEFETIAGMPTRLVVENMIVTHGPGGVSWYAGGADDPSGVESDTPVHFPVEPVEAVNVTGAGDAFVAGFVFAVVSGAELSGGVRAGISLARMAIMQTETAVARVDVKALCRIAGLKDEE